MPSQEPGPGSSASRIPGIQVLGMYVEGPSSAHSGSSQQHTASKMQGKGPSVSLQYGQCLGTAKPS